MPAGQHAYQDIIIYTCDLPTVIYQNVLCEKQQWREKHMAVTKSALSDYIGNTRRVITELGEVGHVVIILKAQLSHSDHKLIHLK